MIKLKYKNDIFKMVFDVDHKSITLTTDEDKIIYNIKPGQYGFIDIALNDIEKYLDKKDFILYYGYNHYMVLSTLEKGELEKLENKTDLKFILIFDKKVIKELYKVIKAFQYLIGNEITSDIHKPKYSEELKEFVNQAADRNLAFMI